MRNVMRVETVGFRFGNVPDLWDARKKKACDLFLSMAPRGGAAGVDDGFGGVAGRCGAGGTILKF